MNREASAGELAILNHPDQRTSWIVVHSVRFTDALPDLEGLARQRLPEIAKQAPIVAARWRGGRWQIGSPPAPIVVEDPLTAPELLRRFDLEREPPVRLLVGSDGDRLALAAHHAALDGRSIIAVIGALLGQPIPSAGEPVVGPRTRPNLRDPVRRLVAPADRVAPSSPPARQECFATREVNVQPPNITGQIAQACVAAAAARNARLGWPWRRVGLSIAVAGPPGIGNQASYRRLDLRATDAVAPAVQDAVRTDAAPAEMVSAPRALRLLGPVAERFSDSILISNLGRVTIPGVAELAPFPVPRGRSAVGFGSSAVENGRSTLSIRARDLSQSDAEDLLEDALSRLVARDAPEPARGQPGPPQSPRIGAET